MLFDRIADWRMTQYFVNALLFLLNVASWYLFWTGSRVGFLSERILSLGRMAMCVAIGSLVLSPLVLWSPIAEVLWLPFMDISKRSHEQGFVALWTVCLTIFSLEMLYFTNISKVHPHVM
jgi:hypothetical protein